MISEIIQGQVNCAVTMFTLPSLLYNEACPLLSRDIEACPLLSRDINSLDFTVTRGVLKVFGTWSTANISERDIKFLPVKQLLLGVRTAKFLQRFITSENALLL